MACGTVYDVCSRERKSAGNAQDFPTTCSARSSIAHYGCSGTADPKQSTQTESVGRARPHYRATKQPAPDAAPRLPIRSLLTSRGSRRVLVLTYHPHVRISRHHPGAPRAIAPARKRGRRRAVTTGRSATDYPVYHRGTGHPGASGTPAHRLRGVTLSRSSRSAVTSSS